MTLNRSRRTKMKVGRKHYRITPTTLNALSAEEHYVCYLLEKVFGSAMQIQGKQADGTRQLWVYKRSRSRKVRRRLQAFVDWATASTQFAVNHHGWGVALKKDPNKNIRLLVPRAFLQWREEIKPKAKPFEPKTLTGYKLGGVNLLISQWGNLYLPGGEVIGKVCGSRKTSSGAPCRRWCNEGHCKGH
jgi:hypothetical protein